LVTVKLNVDKKCKNGFRSKVVRSRLLILTLVLLCMFTRLHAESIEVGQNAPVFTLLDQTGQSHSLSNYSGQWVILYFYPKDDTPGCTKEACAFRDDYRVIVEQNTQVLGVSVDNQKSHATFANKYSLPFPLLADTGGKVAKQYQALTSLGPLKFAKRHTFVIDPQGKIRKIYRKVNVANHSQQILSDLQALKSNNL